MRNDYNLIAPLYDIGVRILFGKGVYQSYTLHLDRVKAAEKVLVVGGGSGLLLPRISEHAEVDYVELSSIMIRKAKRRRSVKVQYYHGDYFRFNTTNTYDWIVFPYFLDLFSDEEIREILTKSWLLLKPSGGLIVSDFDLPSSNWHRALIAFSMIILRTLVSLKITRLAPIRELLNSDGYEEYDRQVWAKGFIFSSIFRKRETFV